MKINEEIKNLKAVLDTQEDLSPNYLSKELKNLQNYVLLKHADLERGLEIRILYQIGCEMHGSKASFETWNMIHRSPVLIRIINELSFRVKLKMIIDFNDGLPEKSLKALNNYRNNFAHLNGTQLRKSYNYQTTKGKLNIRNFLRSLIKAQEDLNKYYERIYLSPTGKNKEK